MNSTKTETVRAKCLYQIIDERVGNASLPLLSVSIHHGVVPRNELVDRPHRAEELTNYKVCHPGDIVLNRMRAFQGAVGVSSLKGIVSPDYLVLRPTGLSGSRFLHHVFRSSWFVNEMVSRLRGIGGTESGSVRTPRINAEDLGDIPVRLPPLDEQRRIADFLDDENARIDAIISAREAQAKCLKEKRFTAIRNTLSRGLRHGKTRSTSLEWLPECPADWKIVPLRYLTACLDGRRIPLSSEERALRSGPYPYYGASSVVDHVDGYLFNEPLVLLGEDGAQLGNPLLEIAFFVDGPIWVNNHAHVLRPTNIDGRFLAEVLNVFDRELCMSGATREKITQDAMGGIAVPVPPAHVQDDLTKYFTDLLDGLKRLETGLRSQTVLLNERRQALITAAVTGQFDVTAGREVDLS